MQIIEAACFRFLFLSSSPLPAKQKGLFACYNLKSEAAAGPVAKSRAVQTEKTIYGHKRCPAKERQ